MADNRPFLIIIYFQIVVFAYFPCVTLGISFYITPLAIIQAFQGNNINKKMAAIHSAKFVMGYPCVRPYILLYIHCLAF